MTGSDQNQNSAGMGIILVIVATHYRTAIRIAALAAVIVGVLGTIYLFFGQPVRRSSVLEFRPTFAGADAGQYPNGLPFSPSEIAAGSVLDIVYDTNGISAYCPREAFRGGFFVDQRSAQSTSLDAEYQGRLGDSRISSVERQRLQDEYDAKREALPLQYRLVFVQPESCGAIPPVVVRKAMTDTLTTWAEESETKRGVLDHQVEVLTPAMLDVDAAGSRLLRADLLRTSLWRVISNIEEVSQIPGAALVRLGPERVSFLEISNKLTDLARSSLEPFIVGAGQSMVREASAWVIETVTNAERTKQAAEGRAAAYRDALREYSGTVSTTPVPPTGTTTSTTPRGEQQLTPQIDRSFIDRLIEMSQPNTAFRRELTQSMVRATVEAVAAEERAGYYRRLLQSLREPAGVSLSPAEIDASLSEIVQRGKFLTQQFNDLYKEFSRVSLRSAAALYQTDKPVVSETYRAFTIRSLFMLVVVAFIFTLLVALVGLFARERLMGAATSVR